MANKERIIKLIWNIKKHKECQLNYGQKYTEQNIVDYITKIWGESDKSKTEKIEIITVIVTSEDKKEDVLTYKHYYVDYKTEFTYGECSVNILVKNKSNIKPLTFEEKIGLLESWMKTNQREPKPGDLENEFDVGKFYQQSIKYTERFGNVTDIVERYTKTND